MQGGRCPSAGAAREAGVGVNRGDQSGGGKGAVRWRRRAPGGEQSLLRGGGAHCWPVDGPAVGSRVVGNKGVARGAGGAPATRHAAQANKVPKEEPEAGHRKAGGASNNVRDVGRGLGRAVQPSVHVAPPTVHGCDGCQAHHLPRPSVHSGGRAGQPQVGAGGRRGAGAGASQGGGDGGQDGGSGWALAEVMLGVGVGGAADAVGVGEVHAHCGGEGVVHQPPVGLFAAVLPRQPPQSHQRVLQLLEGATLLLCKWSQPLVAAAAARRGSNDVCATADGVVEEGDGAGGVSLPAEAGQQHRQRVVVRGCRQWGQKEREAKYCDCEVTETAALHVPGRTIRQRMKDCRGHSSGSGGMAGWQGGGSAGRQCADGSAWRAHPAAAPRHMSTRGVQRGGSGACRAGAVRALAQPGRPGGRGRGILWYRGRGGGGGGWR